MKTKIKEVWVTYKKVTGGIRIENIDKLYISYYSAVLKVRDDCYSDYSKKHIIEIDDYCYIIDRHYHDITKRNVIGEIKEENVIQEIFINKLHYIGATFIIGKENLIDFIDKNDEINISKGYMIKNNDSYHLLAYTKKFKLEKDESPIIKNALDKLTDEEKKFLGLDEKKIKQ